MIYYTINTNNYIENLQAPDWVQVITEVEDLGDPVRSSRKDKILCPFEGPSVYIDASKVHLLNDEFRIDCFAMKSAGIVYIYRIFMVFASFEIL